MRENVNARDELAKMLTEIYYQLDKLESALDSNFENMRKQWHDVHTTKLSECSKRIHLLETEYAYNHENSESIELREAFQRQPSIKLELGF